MPTRRYFGRVVFGLVGGLAGAGLAVAQPYPAYPPYYRPVPPPRYEVVPPPPGATYIWRPGLLVLEWAWLCVAARPLCGAASWLEPLGAGALGGARRRLGLDTAALELMPA